MSAGQTPPAAAAILTRRSHACYTEVIRLDPKYVRAYYVRAIAFANKGDLDKSIEDFSEAIRLAPKLAVLYCGRGLRYQTKGEYGKAIADYNQALAIFNPNYAVAFNNRGVAWPRHCATTTRPWLTPTKPCG